MHSILKPMKSHSQSKGFTLVELLVVIAIIGILSSIVLSSLNSSRAKARDAKRISDLKQIQLALELYSDLNGGFYPRTLSLLEVNGVIPKIPVDPSGAGTYSHPSLGTSGYFYAGLSDENAANNSATCVSYHLGANLEVDSPNNMNQDHDVAHNSTNFQARYTCYAGSPSAADFNGLDDGNGCGAVGAGQAGRFCFDLRH